MDMTELLKMGTQLFINSNRSGDTGSHLDANNLTSALSALSGGGSKSFDLGSLLSKMNSGGLGDVAKSWLGDGNNAPVSPEQITGMFGADTISAFASKLGLSEQEAAGGLSDALPHMVDNASSGGSLLDSIGGVSGTIGLVTQIFK